MDDETSPALIRRVYARFTDYLLWGMATTAVLSFDIGRFYSPTGLYYLSFCLFPFAEAFALYRFGTTIGKKMSGIAVVSVNERLSFKAALIRSWLVFVFGFALFLPYVSLIAPVICLLVYARRRTMPWDVRSGTLTVERPVRTTTKVLAVCFCLSVLFGYALTTRLLLSQNSDADTADRELAEAYRTRLRPALLSALTVESSFSEESRSEALVRLEAIRRMLKKESDAYKARSENIGRKIALLPDGDFKRKHLNVLEKRKERASAFLFREAVRIDLMKKALENLRAADISVRDGAPVFGDEKSKHLFKAYLDAFETFLAVQDQENVRLP